jgi:hypothetical protein
MSMERHYSPSGAALKMCRALSHLFRASSHPGAWVQKQARFIRRMHYRTDWIINHHKEHGQSLRIL